MDTQTINQQYDVITLAKRMGAKFHKAGKVFQAACPLHGGQNKQAFTVWPDTNTWTCYTREECNRGGHDVIAFVMARDGVDFKTAVKTLTGEIPTPPSQPRPSLAAEPARREFDLPKAGRLVDAAHARLMNDPQAQPGRDYLTRRALIPWTWIVFQLGFIRWTRGKPAITIPRYDGPIQEAILTGVKIRFTEVDQTGQRFSSIEGSDYGGLFGSWYAVAGHQKAILLEGEINALSVIQLRLAGINAFSFGSQSGAHGLPEAAKDFISGHRDVWVWADDVWTNPKQANTARDLAALVKGKGKRIQSLTRDGLKWDANEFLKAGVLQDRIEKITSPHEM